jgi:hypothetical protein
MKLAPQQAIQPHLIPGHLSCRDGIPREIIRVPQVSQGQGELMKSDVMADRRDAPRYPLILIAEIEEIPGGSRMTARTADVSRTGCYLDTLTPASKGAMFKLQLMRGVELFQTQALVVYVSPGLGMGVRFHEYVTKTQLLILDRWLSEASKNA